MELHNFNNMIDLYGFKPRLFINGYSKKGTAIGIIFSLITWIFMITITVYYCNKLFISKELHTLASVRSATSSDNVYVNKDNFVFAFALEDPRYNLYVDEEIYYPEVFFKHGIRNEKGQFDYSDSTQLITERCSEINFGEKFQGLVNDFPMENMYCIKNLNYSLTGSFAADEYSFIVLNMYPCRNNTPEKKCKPQERLDYYLDGAFFTFQYQNFIFDPNDFDEPFKPKIGDYMTTISKKYFKNIYIYLKKHLLTTDTGLIFESKKEQQMTKYDYGSDMLSFQASNNFMQLTFRMSLDVDEVSRSYTKAQTIISYIGGFITFLQTIFNLLTDILTNNFIYEKIINKIFFFKKDDEAIVQKNLRKKINLPTLQYSQNNNSFIKNLSENKNNNSIISNNNSLNDKSASIHLNNNDDNSFLKYNRNTKEFNKRNSLILKLQNNNISPQSQNKIKDEQKLSKNNTFSLNNKNKISNISNTKVNLVSNNDNNNKKIFYYNNKNLIASNFFSKGKQKERKKLYNSYLKRLFYTCFKKDPKINLFYKGVTIIKQKLDIISIIKDSFHMELIKNFYFGKEHIILLDNFFKNEILEYKVKKNKFDIDKDIIVDDDIINSFEVILNRGMNNNYKNEENNNNNNNNFDKIDKFFIDAVIRQNKS